MKRHVMHTSLSADVGSPQWKTELAAMKKMGVSGISSVTTVNRPGFTPTCEFPFVCVSGKQGRDDATYDLTKFNPKFWEHNERIVDYVNELGLIYQVDTANEPSLRHGSMICFRNCNGLNITLASFRGRPSGRWAEIHEAYLVRCAQLMRRIKKGMWLPTLEGTGSEQYEAFAYQIMKRELGDYLIGPPLNGSYSKAQFNEDIKAWWSGKRDGIIVISNSVKNVYWVIHSPHLNVNSDISKYAKENAVISDDGTYPNTPELIAKRVKVAKAKGVAIFESLLGGMLSGESPLNANGEPTGGQVSYERRVRPTMQQLSRGIVARMIKALCS